MSQANTPDGKVEQLLHKAHVPPIQRVLEVFNAVEGAQMPSPEEMQQAFMVRQLFEFSDQQPIGKRSIDQEEGDPYSPEGQALVTIWSDGSVRFVKRRIIQHANHNVTLDTTYTLLMNSPLNPDILYEEDTEDEGKNAVSLVLENVTLGASGAAVVNSKTGAALRLTSK